MRGLSDVAIDGDEAVAGNRKTCRASSRQLEARDARNGGAIRNTRPRVSDAQTAPAFALRRKSPRYFFATIQRFPPSPHNISDRPLSRRAPPSSAESPRAVNERLGTRQRPIASTPACDGTQQYRTILKPPATSIHSIAIHPATSRSLKMPKNTVNVCLLGTKFMGRAHANAFLKVNKFFTSLPAQCVMHTVVGRSPEDTSAFQRRWGFANMSLKYKEVFNNPEIDLIDVTSPNNQHAEHAIAALEAGKHVACEKPLAGSLDDARAMRDAARKAKKSKTFVWYVYRRVPAVALAHQLVKSGRLGRIYHIRAWYLQDWAGPSVPLIWRFSKKVAGSGSHGDLGAHIIDMARFITGEEVTEVIGSVQETFIKEREVPTEGSKGGIAAGASGGTRKMGKVDVDDATVFLARMKGGAIATFEATRFATGNQNKNGMEINGEKGSVMFNFEDMNRLSFYDATEERKTQAWRNIMVTHGGDHPYADAWWPDAHVIGYEHTFINETADIIKAIAGQQPVVPLPDFEDAFKTQAILEAAVLSAAERRPVKISEIK
jgi:predicted dehydrogenase